VLRTLLLAEPRGFCAGVVRAIDALDRLLNQVDEPVYVFHEIVHNRYIVDGFRSRGAVFIDDISEAPLDLKPSTIYRLWTIS
jgi:4-hydroxy-3-methylbut-2-enyl diphosphate reductase